jgi:hypothetical protein
MNQAPYVDSYRFGKIVIDGQAYDQDLIILPQGIIANWRREQGHYLQPDDLAAVLEGAPDLLVIGQGAVGRMAVAPAVAQVLAEAGIEVIVQWSGKACQTYNGQRQQKQVALALHLTC